MLKLTPKKRVLFVRRLTPVLLAIFGVFSLAFVSALNSPKLAYATTSNTINFQARLQTRAGGIVPDGDYNVEFKLYDASTSSGSSQGSCTSDIHCLWVETRTSTNKVHVTNGYLSVQLGSVNPFGSNIPWSQNLWLTMNIGGTSTPGWDGEMDPRLPLTAVPYAFTAGSAAQLTNSSDGFVSTLSIQAPTVGNQTFQIQNQGAAGTYNILTAPTGQDGYVKLQSGSITQQIGSLSVDGTMTAAGATLTSGGLSLGGSGSISLNDGTITLGGTTVANFTTPVGSTVHTKISIPTFDPGAFGQVIALGLPSTNCDGSSSTSCSARVISIFDARTQAHQPSISIFSPDENNVVGFSWDGSNSLPLIKSSTSKIGFSTNGAMPVYIDDTGSVAVLQVGIAGPSGQDGALVLSNSTTNAQVTIRASNATSSYTIQLPSSYGTVGQCMSMSGVSGNVETFANSSCLLQGGNSLTDNMTIGTNDSYALNLETGGSNQVTIAAGGATTFRNSANSTAGFLVEQQDSTPVLDVDTQNARVGIGTSTPSRPLDVVTNNSLTNAPSIKLEQQGTGDTSIEFKDANGKSFFAGMDQSDGGKFKIASSTSAATSFTVGQTTLGGSVATGYFGEAFMYKVATSATGGTATGVTLYVATVDGSSPHAKVALYSHDAANNRPGNLIASSASQTLTTGYNTIPISATVSASTTYWIGVTPEGNNTAFNYVFNGGTASPTALYGMTYSGSWPSPAGAPFSTDNSKDWTLYLNVTPSGAVDSFNGTDLLSLTDTGALTLQNSTNSSAAFQIQNASSASIFNVNTTGSGTVTVSGAFQANSIDATSASALTIGNGSATAINLGNTTNNITTTVNGTLLVKPTSTHDSVTAFEVQKAGGGSVIDVDTVNGRLGVGTNTPGRTVDVSINTSTTDSMPLRLSQTGVGDVGIEFQTNGKTFISGIDNSDGKFKISSTITNGGSSVNFGNTATGGTDDNGNNGDYECSKFTATVTGTVSTLTVIYHNIDAANKSAQAALYSSTAAGVANAKLGSSSTVTLSANGPYTFTLTSSVNVTSGTAYWICASSNTTSTTTNNPVYDNGSTNQSISVTSGFSFGTWPSTMPGPDSYYNIQYEMYATVTAASNQFNAPLFSLSDSGQATFQNTADSTSAFQVQNANGNSLFNVDSSNNNISFFGSSTAASLSVNWTSTSAINGASPQARYGATTVTANGYIYVMGGTADSNTVGSYSANTYYAKINADGTVSSTWTAGSTLPYASYKATAFTANGYVYYLGGWDGSNARNDVSYAKLNADGSMGAWQSGGTMSSRRSSGASVYLNGYVYVTGGYNNSAFVGSTMYAKVNANGTLGSWSTTAALPASATIARESMVAANGYIYLMGGSSDNTAANGQTTVYYAKPNTSTGAISSWSTSANTLPSGGGLTGSTAVVSNGYVYNIGGVDTNSFVRKVISYAQLPAAGGDLGAWTISSSRLPDGLWDAGAVVVNGYVYQIGGNDSSASTTSVSTIYFASFNRVQVAGSLDLVGSQGATLADGGSDPSTGSTGGSVTAGNGMFVGSLQVQGQGSFGQSLAVNGAFNAGNMFSVDASQDRVTIGPAVGDTTGPLLVLGIKTNSGDPSTEVDGAMYYNSNMGSFRCGVSGTWQSCVGGLLKSNTSIQAGDTISNTITETNFATNYSLPANYCVPGRVIRVTAAGIWNATGNPNLSVKVKLGSTVIAQHLNDGLTTVTNMPWRLDFQFICDAAPSASSAIEAQGQINLWSGAAVANFWALSNTSTVNVATNAAQTLQMSMQFSAANASNNITMRQFIVEGLGP